MLTLMRQRLLKPESIFSMGRRWVVLLMPMLVVYQLLKTVMVNTPCQVFFLMVSSSVQRVVPIPTLNRIYLSY